MSNKGKLIIIIIASLVLIALLMLCVALESRRVPERPPVTPQSTIEEDTLFSATETRHPTASTTIPDDTKPPETTTPPISSTSPETETVPIEATTTEPPEISESTEPIQTDPTDSKYSDESDMSEWA